MVDQPQAPRLVEALRFRRPPWWDPIPEWIIVRLPERDLFRLAVVQLEAQKAVIEVQMRLTEQALEIIGPMVR